jgi:hypothetical protein
MNIIASLRLLVASALLLAAGSADATQGREWDFTVYLDDREIGYHRFRLHDRGLERELESEARFNVKILFFNAYRYEHDTREKWGDQCLRQIESRTDDNGTLHDVRGEQEENRFVVYSGTERLLLPACVMTFAYWNPDFRRQGRLLNPQTGEYLDVTIEPTGRDRIMVRGETVDASRYALRAGNLDITLWYSEDDHWLALDSMTAGRRRLRYRIE